MRGSGVVTSRWRRDARTPGSSPPAARATSPAHAPAASTTMRHATRRPPMRTAAIRPSLSSRDSTRAPCCTTTPWLRAPSTKPATTARESAKPSSAVWSSATPSSRRHEGHARASTSAPTRTTPGRSHARACSGVATRNEPVRRQPVVPPKSRGGAARKSAPASQKRSSSSSPALWRTRPALRPELWTASAVSRSTSRIESGAERASQKAVAAPASPPPAITTSCRASSTGSRHRGGCCSRHRIGQRLARAERELGQELLEPRRRQVEVAIVAEVAEAADHRGRSARLAGIELPRMEVDDARRARAVHRRERAPREPERELAQVAAARRRQVLAGDAPRQQRQLHETPPRDLERDRDAREARHAVAIVADREDARVVVEAELRE